MPTFAPPPPNPSTTTTAAASSAFTPSEVSFTFDSIKQFANAFLSRFEQSQKLTQDILMDLSMQNKGKKTVNDYSTFSPNPSFSAAPSENYQYGMPPNYFAGQTPPPGSVRPSRAELVRSVPLRADRLDRSLKDRSDRCHGAQFCITATSHASSCFG